MLPFANLSFCCTGIPLTTRDDLAKKVLALGGTHYSDLMSDVNYLIVGETNTDKYIYCVKRRHDVHFINADAIVTIYTLWLKGEEDSLPKLLILNYLKPIFEGMTICMARIVLEQDQVRELFPRGQFRSKGIKVVTNDIKLAEFLLYDLLTKLIIDNGGRCTDSLTTGNSCVVSTQADGRRYSKALEWDIQVVHPIYIFDCLLRGAPLRLDDYVLTSESSEYSAGCEVWEDIIRERSIRRVSKTDDVRKRTETDPQIWNSILGQTAKPVKKTTKSGVWDDKQTESNWDDDIQLGNDTPKGLPKEKDEKYLFLGINFLIVGFPPNQADLLSKVIETHNGEISTVDDFSSISTILLPATNGAQSTMMLRSLPSNVKTRITNSEIKIHTEWFIERSIFYKRLTPDQWSAPLKGLIPLNKQFKICISGFTGIELLHIEKLINYLNFEFCDSLASQRDLLIVNVNLFKATLVKNSPQLFQYKYQDITNCPIYQEGVTSVSTISSKNKINAAKKWQIPIVSIAYLWEVLELLSGKATLIMPDILDLKWCLYAPSNYARPKSLLEYVKNLGSHTEVEEDLIRLPSPRKNSGVKQKYGRLTGREDSLKLQGESKYEDEEFDVTIDEGVGYQDLESVKSDRELLKRLGSSPQASEGEQSENSENSEPDEPEVFDFRSRRAKRVKYTK